ncbi:MAG: transposase [Chlamydiales bacterium]
MSKLGQTLSQYWSNIQGSLFPQLEEQLDPLTEKQQQLTIILEVVRIEQFIPDYRGYEGRPRKTRAAIARSFVAKMVYNMSTTRALWERLHSDKNLRRICGWENSRQIPSEATFSRAMADFAETQLPQRVHEALIKKAYGDTEL